MSMSVLLVPLAVALCVTAAETIEAIQEKCKNPNDENSRIQTRFNDVDILMQTLDEHGLNVNQIDQNHVVVKSNGGTLKYSRDSEGDPFFIEIESIENTDCLISDLDELENEYDRNVQSFTYHRILQNLPPDMSIEEDEVLEDESILLTLNIKE